MNHSHSLKIRFTTHLAAALLLAASSTTHAWDWNWGFGKSISGSGTIKSETRNVTGFTAIKLALPANVVIRQGKDGEMLVVTEPLPKMPADLAELFEEQH